MGRPLNKKYFGNRNVAADGTLASGSTLSAGAEIGGEGVASVTITQGTGKTDGSKTVTFGAPTMANGVRATGTANVAGGVLTITITNKGSGYDAPPSVTVTGGGTGWSYTAVLTTDSGAVGTYTNKENAIKAYACATGGALVEVDIQKQVSAKRYRFNSDGQTSRTGTNIGRLRWDAVADGTYGYTAAQGVEMNIIASDAAGGTYLVRKLTGRTCTLNPVAFGSTPGTLFGLGGATSAGTVFTAGKQYKWTFGTADATTAKILNA